MLLFEHLGNKYYWKKSREICFQINFGFGGRFFLRNEGKNIATCFLSVPVLLTFFFFFQNKTCVQTLEGHAQNVSCVSFHPELPIIITGSEDGNFFSDIQRTGEELMGELFLWCR